jgi:hypothetical protein
LDTNRSMRTPPLALAVPLSANVRETAPPRKFSVEGEQATAAREPIIKPSPRSPRPLTEVTSKAKRRFFTAEYKRKIRSSEMMVDGRSSQHPIWPRGGLEPGLDKRPRSQAEPRHARRQPLFEL